MIQFGRNGTSARSEGCLEDHLDAGRLFYLPNALAVVERDGGLPEFRLVRYGGDVATVSGGFLSAHFELRREGLDELRMAEPAASLEPVSFESAAVRLVVRSRTADRGLQEGPWHPVQLSGHRQLWLIAHLASTDTSMLASLLSQGAESVELELALHYRGLVPGIAGFAVIECGGFMERLRPLLAERELRPDEVVAAYLSVATEGIVRYRPLDALDATIPADDELMEELALRSLDRFFRRVEANGALMDTDSRYRLVDPSEEPTGSCPIGLHTARTVAAEHRLAWSVSELHEALTDPELRAAHFPVIGEVSPFADRRFNVANSLPFDPSFLRRVVVDVRYTGPFGTFEHSTFRFPDDGDFHEIRTRFPSINTGFQLESRVKLLLMPPGGGWPFFWPEEAEFVNESEALVEVTAERSKVRVCRVAIDPRAFLHASRIACVLQDEMAGVEDPPLAAVDLIPGREAASFVIPKPPESTVPMLSCLAFPPEGVPGPPLPLVTAAACPSFLQIPAHKLEVLEPDTIQARLSPRAKTDLLFAAVAFKQSSDPETSEGQLRTFSMTDDEPSVVWKAWRASVFDTLQYLHRAQFVTTDSSGRALPMQFGGWSPSTATELLIDVEGINGPTVQPLPLS